MNIRCIAIDDEPLALDKMEGYIGRVPFLTLEAKFDNAISAIEYLKENETDLIFLDIQMEGLSGIQMLESLKIHPKVILTTAYDQFALKGYELDVTDYLLKPIAFDRFLKAVDKVYEILQAKQRSTVIHKEVVQTASRDEFIFVKTEYRLEKVNFRDILFIEGMKDYLRIHCLPDKRIMTLMSFMKMEQLLPTDLFVRVHKSFIVSLEKIHSIERNHIRIGEHRIPIGESYRKQFWSLLQNKGLKIEES
ncbi:MAG: LytTR family DNA-binding domain-containing protein [Bacteroidetes bacterium]|nr:LytTR family DNA-binding domain-containing protein [Bacteroidota bacterium]